MGSQIQLVKFDNMLNEVKLRAWIAFNTAVTNFLGNKKLQRSYDWITCAYREMGCNISLKIHFLGTHLDFFSKKIERTNYGKARPRQMEP